MRLLLGALAVWFRVEGRADAAARLFLSRRGVNASTPDAGDAALVAGQEDPHARTRVQQSDVRIWANADFVEVDKYRRELTALTDVGVSPMVRLELRDPFISTLVVPELEFEDLLRVSGGSAPKYPDGPMNETLATYVMSGHTLILTLSATAGLNFPLRLMNEVFDWELQGAEIPTGEVLKETEAGLAFAFSAGPPKMAVPGGGVHAVRRASLPPRSRCVYGSTGFDACAVGFVPTGQGAVIFVGYPSAAPTATPDWDAVLALSAIMGRRLPQLMRGNMTLSGTSQKKWGEGKLEIFGRPGTPDGKPCVAWRRTLNCHPSGPRDQKGDRACDVFIPTDESGYCECADGSFTAAATCSHKAFTCDNACGKVGEQFRTVYGEAYEPPQLQDMLDQLSGADADLAKARSIADHAVQRMSKATTSSMDIVRAQRDWLKHQPDAWEVLDAAGRKAVDAAKVMHDMVDVATHKPGRGANVATTDNRPWWISKPAGPAPAPGTKEAEEYLGR